MSQIQGLTFTTGELTEPPMITVVSDEKAGKSSCAATLFGWPSQGAQPLVWAWDPTGPEACATTFGLRVPKVVVRDYPGATWYERGAASLRAIEAGFANGQRPFTSVVVDCASTMGSRLFEDARQTSNNPDPRSYYADISRWGTEFVWRVRDLGVPVIWLAWLKEPVKFEERGPGGKKLERWILGGLNIMGDKLPRLIGGKSEMIFILEKRFGLQGDIGLCSDGQVRIFHTREWRRIRGGGRYEAYFPETIPAHLGYALDLMLRRAPATGAQSAPVAGAPANGQGQGFQIAAPGR